MTGLPFSQVDAFTSRPFSGNPAAVFMLPRPRSRSWMQAVAREMNLSETAFLRRRGGLFQLRWFTPSVEVELCGHATLASAHVLFEEGLCGPDDVIRFRTRSGLLTARRRSRWIELDFPAKPAKAARAPAGLAKALGAAPIRVAKNGAVYLAELGSEEALRGLRPDFPALERLKARGIIVTSRSDSRRYDFVSRYFGPREGIPEDPVTGSAHCVLAPFWGARLGKDRLIGYQASARGGVVRVRLRGERVLLGGQAVTVLRGRLQA